ncbi:MAG: nicotinate-nucleotide--dimethylbenzimidazole phosphoribosyltransferase [Pseudomonadota bacterium]|nr:nicotinate-nucleotide--dimethylbenzimidazole phosphoribosyltransferase [Pseudomonadota bacterium]HJO36688.1 nicotinate-nucleotide--dimethylbenzimidazole phosphoribosyltransferase [Gammaproteobacteria bacterium]
MKWWLTAPPAVDALACEAAMARQRSLAKPPGSLGRLEHAVVALAGQQRRLTPSVDTVAITVFAADHGVARRGVSAYPQEITQAMLRLFATGGAAINVLANRLGASLEVVDVGTCGAPVPGARSARIAPGTADMVEGPAMSVQQTLEALAVGHDSLARTAPGTQLFIAGEMGIGNTTAAAALACALTGAGAGEMTGPGTGLMPEALQRKQNVVAAALRRHELALDDPLALLAALGGLEIAAMTGAYLRAAQLGLPCLVDGYIASVAALLAVRLQPAVRPWLHFAHRSAEPGHHRVLRALDAVPLLELDMRLGEGSGAAVAVPLLQAACALHAQMATIEQLGI